jgi:anti-anti-sigma regulatory factor
MQSAVEITSAPPSVAIVALSGAHDLSEYKQLKAVFAAAAIRAPNVIIDLSRCALIDSTVMAMLLNGQSIVTRDYGRFVVALPEEPNPVTRLAELVQLAELVPTYVSVEAALASFQPAESAAAQPV